MLKLFLLYLILASNSCSENPEQVMTTDVVIPEVSVWEAKIERSKSNVP
ncbi:MAG: hypothetical protein IPJ13_17590 [Saprospiraceae bacterium]|nr:hypothetical protein [Saprospiraceae bacterium]